MKNEYKIVLFVFLCYLLGGQIKAQKVDDILNKMFDNAGGIEKFERIKSMKIEQNIDNGARVFAILIYYLKPNKVRIELINSDIEKHLNIYNNGIGWQQSVLDNKIKKMTPEKSSLFIKDASLYFFDKFLDYKEKGKKIVFKGRKNIEGQSCFKLKITNANKEKNLAFIDVKSYRLILQHYIKKSKEKKNNKIVVMSQYISNYKEVEGIFLPHNITLKTDNRVVQTSQYKYTINPILDSIIFEYPKNSIIEEPDIEYAKKVFRFLRGAH